MRAVAAAVTVVLGLSLGACGDDDPEPEFAPTEPSSGTTASSPTVEPSEPEPWQKNTRAGAVAFVKHWFQVFNEAQLSGNTEELQDISARNCVSCKNLAEHIKAIYADGGFFENEGWQVKNASLTRQAGLPRKVTKMLVRVLRTAERWKESADSEINRNPASTADYEIRTEWVDGAWVVERLVQLT